MLFLRNNQLPIWTILILSESTEIVSIWSTSTVGEWNLFKGSYWIIIIVTNLHVPKWQTVVKMQISEFHLLNIYVDFYMAILRLKNQAQNLFIIIFQNTAMDTWISTSINFCSCLECTCNNEETQTQVVDDRGICQAKAFKALLNFCIEG